MSDRTAKYMHCQKLDGRAPLRAIGLCSSHHSEQTRQEQRETWLVCDDNPERNHRQQPRPDAERHPLEEKSRFGMFLIFFLMCGFFIPPAANHPDDEPRSCSRSSRLQVSGGAFAFSNES